ncbi:MAG: hypothetical protein DMF67_04330 [Acidobacteria bacterium]|nr:MAG: hypothetical protein DMF67_04330 [Acidobacteriota bacterium]
MNERRGDRGTGRRGEKENAQARPAYTSPRLPVPASPPPWKEGEDFYREGAFVVFTARYHLRRGYCCESGCRHCPYRVAADDAARDEEKSVEKVVE